MKKIFIIMMFILTSIASQGQIYSKIQYYDKFDDIIKTENIKTIVSLENRVITVETKGKIPIEYIIIEFKENGKKDSVVNLVGNIYGYEGYWYCVETKDTTNWRCENERKVKELLKNCNPNFNDERINNIIYSEDSIASHLSFNDIFDLYYFIKYENKYIKEIVERTITTEYTMQFLNRIFWIKKNNGSRIIYMK